MNPLRIFIGYDSKEPVAYSVLSHSIIMRASQPIAIYPLALPHLHRIYTRQRGPTESTEFSLTRFLVPHLCDYEGYAIFMDCDMLCRVDIGDVMLHVLADPGKSVYCCQHDYEPKKESKFLGHPQTAYPRKNWSSFMVFDCAKCKGLTPRHVNEATGLQLHRFMWTTDDKIGALPLDWNWLVGEYPKNDKASILHYTLGGPWFPNTPDDHAGDWLHEYYAMMNTPAGVLNVMASRA